MTNIAYLLPEVMSGERHPKDTRERGVLEIPEDEEEEGEEEEEGDPGEDNGDPMEE